MSTERKGPEKAGRVYTVASLRLNIDEAMKGKTWKLLPEGYRDRDSGKTYPLPSTRQEIQKLLAIPIPPSGQDCGCFYLRRAMKEWRRRQTKRNSAIFDIERRAEKSRIVQDHFKRDVMKMKEAARTAVEEVREAARREIASLTDLFSLGRRGIDGQMKAHLDGTEWQGEKIDAKAFRECFRMVTQAVKGLGLPSDQRKEAESAVLDEVADAIRQTRQAVNETNETLSMIVVDEDETQH